MSLYLDASAAIKLLGHEAESAALARTLEDAASRGEPIRSAALLETEVRRAVTRLGFQQANATRVLDGIELIDIERSTFAEAGLIGGVALRTLDALHVVAALRTDATAFISYDARQIDAARSAGLQVVSPS